MKFLILIFISSLASAEQLNLAKALATARSSNPDLKRLEIAVSTACWQKNEALGSHLPQIGVVGTHYLSADYGKMDIFFGGNQVTTPLAFPQTTATVEASLLIFDGFGSINKFRAASASLDAAESEYDFAKFRLEQEVNIKFYRALAAQELAKVADSNITTLNQHLKTAQVSQRAGAGVKFDSLRIESQLEEAKAEKLLADDNVVLARQSLYQMMGVPTDNRMISGTLPVPTANHIPQGLQLDVSKRSDVQAQLNREIASDRLDSSAAGSLYPKISIFGREEWLKFGDFDKTVKANDNFQQSSAVGLRLTWILYDGGGTWARKAIANNNYLQSLEASKKMLLAAPDEFDSWKRKYTYNTVLYSARLRTIDKSEESVRLATISVRAGVRTHSEVLDAELDLFRAKAGAIRAQLDAAESLNNLELAVGHHLN